MKQFLSFVRKEFYHVFRDSKTLLMLFGLPIALITLFGFALTNEIKNAGIAVLDQAKDGGSQRLIRQFEASQYFDIDQSLITAAQIESAFKKGRIKLAVVFPTHFQEELLHLGKTQLQVIVDASDPNTATTLVNYIGAIVGDYQQQLSETAAGLYQIRTEIRMLYNPQLKGATNFVPGVIALVLLLICVLMTSVSIVREKESGTMEVLLVSPFNPFLVLIAKAIPYFLLSLVNLTVIILMSVVLLGIPFHGNWLLLYFESSLLILTALALGLIISNATSSQQSAMLISLMGMLIPTMLFTGFLFPLENMPWPLQAIANIVPSKWYYIIVKAVMIKGLGLRDLWKETLILTGMTSMLLLLAFKNFKIRLQ